MKDFLSDSGIRDQVFDIVSIKASCRNHFKIKISSIVIADLSQDIIFDRAHLFLVCLTGSLHLISVATILNLSRRSLLFGF